MASYKEIRRAIAMLTKGAEAAEPTADVMSTSSASRGIRQELLLRRVPKSMGELADSVKEKYAGWTQGRGFQGLGMAVKIQDGVSTDEIVLRVYVEKKLSKRECRSRDILVSQKLWVRGMNEEIPTDVIPIGRLKLQANIGPINPVRPGFSIFNRRENKFGTLGCVVSRNGKFYVLSNAHVLSMESTANLNDSIVHPAPADGGGTLIARLTESVKFEFGSSSLLNTVDAAIAEIESGRVSPVIASLGVPPQGISPVVKRGDAVKKVGRTTDLTDGTVEDIDFTTKPLPYRRTSTTTELIQFHNQVACTYLAKSGDSGALVLNSSNRAVGLHFAGSTSIGVFNKIRLVLKAFDVTIVTNSTIP